MKVFLLISYYNDNGVDDYASVLDVYLHKEAADRRCAELNATKMLRHNYAVEEHDVCEDV